MRGLFLMAAVLVAAGAAWAQTTPLTPAQAAFVPDWGEIVHPEEQVYPLVASRHGTGGQAVICCKMGEGLGVNCTLASETPAGQGFGDGALRLSRRLRLTAASHADLAARPDAVFPITVSFASHEGHNGLQIDNAGDCSVPHA